MSVVEWLQRLNPRNIDDAHLKALAADGGVIQINTFSSYLIASPKNPARDAAMAPTSTRSNSAWAERGW